MKVGRKVRKTLNIDAAKLKRVQKYLHLETETDVIDRLLDAYDYERELNRILANASPTRKTFRSPLARRAQCSSPPSCSRSCGPLCETRGKPVIETSAQRASACCETRSSSPPRLTSTTRTCSPKTRVTSLPLPR